MRLCLGVSFSTPALVGGFTVHSCVECVAPAIPLLHLVLLWWEQGPLPKVRGLSETFFLPLQWGDQLGLLKPISLPPLYVGKVTPCPVPV